MYMHLLSVLTLPEYRSEAKSLNDYSNNDDDDDDDGGDLSLY